MPELNDDFNDDTKVEYEYTVNKVKDSHLTWSDNHGLFFKEDGQLSFEYMFSVTAFVIS